MVPRYLKVSIKAPVTVPIRLPTWVSIRFSMEVSERKKGSQHKGFARTLQEFVPGFVGIYGIYITRVSESRKLKLEG